MGAFNKKGLRAHIAAQIANIGSKNAGKPKDNGEMHVDDKVISDYLIMKRQRASAASDRRRLEGKSSFKKKKSY